ncbi:MAG: hypothetical protein ACD_73C00723G0002 [uncultured bacterium]|nr:MAG: hypothetical protein ACD_73C00723G0002 [uncultured bacterium]
MVTKKTQKNYFSQKLGKVNQVLGKLEGEIEKKLNQIKKQSEKSSKLIKKNFDEIVDKIGAAEIYSKASEKTEGLTKEVKKVADEIVAKIKKIDLSKTQDILNDVRTNIDQLVNKLSQAEVVEQAKEKAVSTRNQVLHILNVPTKTEVDSLTKKVGSLEKKIKVLSTKTAEAA